MLVLSRKLGETIRIGDQVKVTILKMRGNAVRIGIEAPNDVRILRAEIDDFCNYPLDELRPVCERPVVRGLFDVA